MNFGVKEQGVDGRMPFCPAPAHSLLVTSLSAANEGSLLTCVSVLGARLVTALLLKVFLLAQSMAGYPGALPAPPGISALKMSALSSQLKSSWFRGGERCPKLSPPAPTAREVHIGAGVVEVFLCASLRSGSGDSSGSAGTSRQRGDAESSEGQHGRGVWDGAEPCGGCSLLGGLLSGMRHMLPFRRMSHPQAEASVVAAGASGGL